MEKINTQTGYEEALRRIAHAQQRGRPSLHLSELSLNALPPEIGELTGLQSLHVDGNQLTALPPEIGELTGLQALDLNGNQLSALPLEIGRLKGLQTLGLGGNRLTALPLEIGKLTGLRKLDLGGNRLTALPPEIGMLTDLQTLDLRDNELTALPPEIGMLTDLQTLDLRDNALTLLSPEIGELTRLQWLNLFGNELTELPPEIGELIALQTFDVGANLLTLLPPEIGELTGLQTLYFDLNHLTALPPELGKLTRLQALDLNGNELTALPPEFGELTGLQTLQLSKNRLTSLPPNIGELTELEMLYLGDNQLIALPPEIGELTELQMLDLSRNQLTVLPPELRKLTLLRQLFLHDNSGLKLSPNILGSDPSKPGYDAKNVPSPASILDFYFGRLAGKTRPLNEVKLILVGKGGAGKTSIVRALRGLPFREGENSTPGIALSDWKMKGCPGGDVKAHVWDFAGQVITHALHQFFFSVRSVYVLVLAGRENSERDAAEYWLRLIKAFGTEQDGVGPPVVVVLNKWDVKGCRPKVDRGALQERYPFIRGFVEVDCKTKKGVAKLTEALHREAADLKWVREPFKALWDDIRLALTKGRTTAAYLTYDAFRKLCDSHGIKDKQEQDSLAEVLHNLGSALNYRNDPRLREATVLKPQWLTKNVYTLMRKAEKQAGVLKQVDIDAALAKIPDKKMRSYLVRLMERFEIAYAARETSTGPWLVPQALPDEQPKEAAEFAAARDATRLRYTYSALPEGLVARAIVRLHEFIEEDDGTKRQWASGAILTREGARALLRAEPQDSVMITVTGPTDARRQLAGLCQAEMRDIHAGIQGLDPDEETQVDGKWIDVKTLEADERKGQQTGLATRDQGTLWIDPTTQNDAYSKKAAREDDVWKPTVFICYSKSNVKERTQFETDLTILMNEGLLARHWHDRMIDPGDEWNSRIQRELSEADIFVVLLSRAALATKYIREKEIPEAMKLHRTGKTIVIPVALEACRWQETELGPLQALPDNGKSINELNPRSKAWKSVADGLARVCKKLMEQTAKGPSRWLGGQRRPG